MIMRVDPLRSRGECISRRGRGGGTDDSVETPIRVSHQLRMEVFFSVWGEDVQGNPIDGPGELRVLRVDKNVILPAVCLWCIFTTLADCAVLLDP